MYVSSSSIFVFTVVAKWLLNVYVIMEKMYAYEAPVVEIIEVEVEKGFASSGYPSGSGEGGTESPL